MSTNYGFKAVVHGDVVITGNCTPDTLAKAPGGLVITLQDHELALVPKKPADLAALKARVAAKDQAKVDAITGGAK